MKKVIKGKSKIDISENNHNPIEIATVALEFGRKHIEVSFANKTLSYRCVISPKEAGESFPAGYFDNHYADISDHFFEQIKTQFQKCIDTLPFEKELASLPPGASRDAYIRYVDTKGICYYYSNVRLSKSGFSVERTAVHEDFNAFYRLLSSRCFFPESETDIQIGFFRTTKIRTPIL